MFAFCKKHEFSALFLARSVLSVPVSINFGAEYTLAEDHKKKVAAAAEDHRRKEAAKRQKIIDAEAAYEEQEAAIPLTECEHYYRNRWDCRNMTNGRLRKEISWNPDPSSSC